MVSLVKQKIARQQNSDRRILTAENTAPNSANSSSMNLAAALISTAILLSTSRECTVSAFVVPQSPLAPLHFTKSDISRLTRIPPLQQNGPYSSSHKRMPLYCTTDSSDESSNINGDDDSDEEIEGSAPSSDPEEFADRLLAKHEEVRKLLQQQEENDEKDEQLADDIIAASMEEYDSITASAEEYKLPDPESIVLSDEQVDIGDEISQSSMDKVEAIAKIAADLGFADVSLGNSSSSNEEAGPVVDSRSDSNGNKPPKDEPVDEVSKSKITAEKQAESIKTIRDNAIEQSKAKSNATASRSVPSYRSLLTFVTTTVLIWLSEPLLSLIDTTVVGKYGGAGATVAASSAASSMSTVVKSKFLSLFAFFGLFNEAKPDLLISQSVLNLASLGPATLLIDNCLYVTYFLSIATTNKLAKALAEKNNENLVRTTSHVLGVAVVLGALMTAFVWGSGYSVLSSIVGDSAATGVASAAQAAAVKEQVVGSAFQYAKIRSSIGMLAVLDIVAQSVCLASLDLKTPVLAVIFTSLTNVIGDWLLVVKFGMGLKGAAIATAAANVVSSSILLSAVYNKFGNWRKQAAIDREDRLLREGRISIGGADVDGGPNKKKEETVLPDFLGVVGSKAKRKTDIQAVDNKVQSTKTKSKVPPPASAAALFTAVVSPVKTAINLALASSARKWYLRFSYYVADVIESAKKNNRAKKALRRKFFGTKGDLPRFVSLPGKEDFVQLIQLAGPIFCIILMKVVCYSAMTLRASDFGMLELASHNVLLRVFFFYTTFGDAFSQAAQTFLPKVLYGNQKADNKGEKDAATSTLSSEERRKGITATLGRMLLLSGIIAVANSGVSSWILHNCGHCFTSDTAIANLMASNSKYMALSVLLHPFIMLCEGSIMASGQRGLLYLVKSYSITIGLLWAMLKYSANSFGAVWKVWFGFQIVRLIQFGARVWTKTVLGSEKDVGMEEVAAVAP